MEWLSTDRLPKRATWAGQWCVHGVMAGSMFRCNHVTSLIRREVVHAGAGCGLQTYQS